MKEFFDKYKEVAIAFSGGCDSAYLCHEAQKYAQRMRAYYVKTQFQPQFEYEDASRFANEYGIDLKVIGFDILKDENVKSNTSQRCYFCKKNIMSLIVEKAKEDGFKYILDGTNASDDPSERQGMKALKEMNVLSPLKICGLTKEEVRKRSKEEGLFTWDKPAYACLATRIPTGKVIEERILDITQKGENFLFSKGFSDFRIRYRDGNALLQLPLSQMQKYRDMRDEIDNGLKKYYIDVLLDEEPRHV